MGKCSHVGALLFGLKDYIIEFGTDLLPAQTNYNVEEKKQESWDDFQQGIQVHEKKKLFSVKKPQSKIS